MTAYVTAVLDPKVTLDELDRLLNEMLDETGGPMTEAEAKKVDRVILGRARRAKTR
jgi:hypothetical protein